MELQRRDRLKTSRNKEIRKEKKTLKEKKTKSAVMYSNFNICVFF